MSCLDDLDDHLRWLAPTDLNLDYMDIIHLDYVTWVLRSCKLYDLQWLDPIWLLIKTIGKCLKKKPIQHTIIVFKRR